MTTPPGGAEGAEAELRTVTELRAVDCALDLSVSGWSLPRA
jgi:hypothetical protein